MDKYTHETLILTPFVVWIDSVDCGAGAARQSSTDMPYSLLTQF